MSYLEAIGNLVATSTNSVNSNWPDESLNMQFILSKFLCCLKKDKDGNAEIIKAVSEASNSLLFRFSKQDNPNLDAFYNRVKGLQYGLVYLFCKQCDMCENQYCYLVFWLNMYNFRLQQDETMTDIEKALNDLIKYVVCQRCKFSEKNYCSILQSIINIIKCYLERLYNVNTCKTEEMTDTQFIERINQFKTCIENGFNYNPPYLTAC